MKDIRANPTEPENMLVLLMLYWRVLLIITIVLIIGIFIYGGWQLSVALGDSTLVPSNVASTSTNANINNAQVDAVLNGFTARKNQFETLKVTPSVIVDPAR